MMVITVGLDSSILEKSKSVEIRFDRLWAVLQVLASNFSKKLISHSLK